MEHERPISVEHPESVALKRYARVEEVSASAVPQADLAVVQAVEALLFAADRPLDLETLLSVFDGAVGESELEAALCELENRYDERHSGVVLTRVAGGYQLRTAPQLGELVARLREVRPMRLSRAAMETLSIVAYRQPVSRSDVESLRGVDSSGVLRSLLELGLVRIVGRREGVGRPLLYGTDERFLSFFGLDSLDSLPRLRETEELEQAHLFRGEEPVAAAEISLHSEDASRN